MTTRIIETRPIAPALGAEIGGVDLSGPLDDGVISEIRQALLQFGVIFFQGQDITPEQHLAFARRFGDLVTYPMVKGLDGYPEIAPVIKLEQETDNFGGIWPPGCSTRVSLSRVSAPRLTLHLFRHWESR